MEWTRYSLLAVSISFLPPNYTGVANTDWSGDKLAGGELRRNNSKTLRVASFFS
jgi:hypothetical protein